MSGAAPSRTTLAAAALLLAALLLRLTDIFGALQYDEIWSLENYASLEFSRIFTELDTPNNQGLNTLFIKFCAQLGAPVWTLRLHSLAAGVVTVAAAGLFAAAYFRSSAAGLAALLFVGFSAPLCAYSQLGRGYSLQLAGLMLYALGLVWTGRPRKAGSWRFAPEMLLILGGGLAVFTLSTSVMYLAVMTLCAWSRCHKPARSTGGVIAAGALLTLLYLGSNFAALNSARRWGVPLGSAAEVFRFFGGTLYALIPATLLPPIAAAFWLRAKASLLILLSGALPLAAALVTNAGPERAYLPLALAAALLAAGGTAAMLERFPRHGRIIALVALLLGSGGAYQLREHWKPADWIAIGRAGMELPANELVVHRATSGYPLTWNNFPELPLDQRARIQRAPHPALWSIDTPAGVLNGSGPDHAERQFEVAVPGEAHRLAGVAARRFALVPLTEIPPADAAVVAVTGELSAEIFQEISAEIHAGPWLQLNPLLPVGTDPGRHAAIWLLAPGRSAESWQRLLRLEPFLSLYRLR